MNRLGFAVVAALAAAGTPGPLPAGDLCGSGPLDILLTNDDGYAAVGIRALYGALREAGHHVLLVAPAKNFSGAGMSFTWGDVSVERDATDPDIYAVAASPATSMLLGATALYPGGRRPDLVVSGINDGANAGATLPLSGTVGAALAATVLLNPPVPALAVNAVRARPKESPESPDNQQHLREAAAYVARLVQASRAWFCSRGSVTRPSLALNVTYPGLAAKDVRGTLVTRQAHASDVVIRFQPGAGGTYTSSVTTAHPDAAGDLGTDLGALAGDYVTVTPIQADYTAGKDDLRDLDRALRPLRSATAR